MQWTIQFGKWLATSRIRESKADRWQEKAWKDEYQKRKTKGKDSLLRDAAAREEPPVARDLAGDARRRRGASLLARGDEADDGNV